MKCYLGHLWGVAIATVMVFFHTMWALLVWLGVAQPVLDFIFRLHMITPAYVVEPFQAKTAIGLVMMTGLVGYVTGWILAYLLEKPRKS